ncbi:hypothetical protein C8N46_103227 [Kordia periserrulae]|uniref:Uncharacterized protein n=1 Tax=Kordia periserrulae TaxID=701523 RepID=A0A2T6C1F0_9FLAO|nr:hypothetical protein [Kordia periserrulae]PTX62129.1 hypothetical protein C8N46_103227 [Kordia periserrulae]
MIKSKPAKLHWNYFLSIETDLIKTSRFIEFCGDNLGTYSIELARILISASSEVDVILREICNLILNDESANNINDYRKVIQQNLPEIIDEPVFIHRYGLEFIPWENWNNDENPDWWRSHNKIKHQRNEHFNMANLQNALNSVGALLICVTYYYRMIFQEKNRGRNIIIDLNKTTELLKPLPQLFKLRNDYYRHPVYLY